jgi:hypothetical protein
MDIAESEIVTLPAGDALHTTATYGTGDDQVVIDSFCIFYQDVLFSIEVDMYGSDEAHYLPFGEAIAGTLVIDEAAKRW